MTRHMLCAKIHRVKVTDSNLDYDGSLTIDKNLMDAAGILPFEKVEVVNIANGARAATYAITGEAGSGDIVMNGAIARLAEVGDPVIILAYTFMEEEEAKHFHPKIVLVNDDNSIREVH